jgi:hypothetical protein
MFFIQLDDNGRNMDNCDKNGLVRFMICSLWRKLSLAALVVLSFVLFYQFALPKVATALMENWCSKNLDSTFCYEALEIHGFHWTIKNPALKRAAALEEAPWLSAAALEVKWESLISPLFILDSPKITPYGAKESLTDVFNKGATKRSSGWFSFRPKIVFQEGSISLRRTSYTFEGWYSEQPKAAFHFAFAKDEESLKCSFERSIKEALFCSQFDRCHVSTVAALLQFLGKEYIPLSGVEGGSLQGALSIKTAESRPLEISGNLIAKDLAVYAEDGLPLISIPLLSLALREREGKIALPEGFSGFNYLGERVLHSSKMEALLSWKEEEICCSTSSPIACYAGEYSCQLNGSSYCRSRLNHEKLQAEFAISQIKVSHADYDVIIESLGVGEKMASYELEFPSRKSFAKLPIKEASLLPKKGFLPIHNIQGLFELKEGVLSSESVKGVCSGLFFSGALAVDYKSKNEFLAKFCCDTVQGPTDALLGAASAIKVQGGFIDIEPNNFMAEVGYSCGSYHYDAMASGIFHAKKLHVNKDFPFAVNHPSCSFSWKALEGNIQVSDIRGSILAMDGQTLQLGGGATFSSGRPLLFDLWLLGQGQRLMRASGIAKADGMVVFDSSSHFGTWPLAHGQFSMKEGEIACQADFTGDLSGSYENMLLLQKFYGGNLKNLADFLKYAKGDVSLSMHYAGKELLFEASGNEALLGDQTVKSWKLQGNCLEDILSIEQASFDDLTLSSRLSLEPHGWKIHDIALSYGADSVIHQMPWLKAIIEQIQQKDLSCQLTVYQNSKFGAESDIYDSMPLAGELSITKSGKKNEVLSVAWHVKDNISIDSIEGTLDGISYRLKKEREEKSFVGTVTVRLEQAISELFPDLYQHGLEGNQTPMVLNGEWGLSAKGIVFSGALNVKDFLFNGFAMKTMSTAVCYEDSKIVFEDFSLKESHATWEVPKFILEKGPGGGWNLFATTILAKNILLDQKDLLHPYRKNKKRATLSLDQLVFHKLKGSLDAVESMSGYGTFSFTNYKKNIFKKNGLNIHKELFSPSSSSKTIMAPATGTVDFSVENGRLFLKKFKDVFNYGKSFQFHLFPGRVSFIDLMGKMNLQLLVTRSSALSHLVETFFLDLSGSLDKPTTNLQRYKP